MKLTLTNSTLWVNDEAIRRCESIDILGISRDSTAQVICQCFDNVTKVFTVDCIEISYGRGLNTLPSKQRGHHTDLSLTLAVVFAVISACFGAISLLIQAFMR